MVGVIVDQPGRRGIQVGDEIVRQFPEKRQVFIAAGQPPVRAETADDQGAEEAVRVLLVIVAPVGADPMRMAGVEQDPHAGLDRRGTGLFWRAAGK